MLNSLNEPTRWRNHSRATKIGQRTWNLKALCSKGVPCLSRMRKRISPASESSISCLCRAKLTRAPLTTERSEAIASSRRTKPWSRTGMLFSGITSAAVDTEPSVTGAYVGTSGWSYPSWRPDFYPAGTKPEEFLRYYSERFSTVELNTTGYRLPREELFARWARAGAGGVPLRAEDERVQEPQHGDVRRARLPARRAARPDPRRRQLRPGRRPARAPLGLVRPCRFGSRSTSATRAGTGSRRSCRRTPSASARSRGPRRSATSASGILRTRTSSWRNRPRGCVR